MAKSKKKSYGKRSAFGLPGMGSIRKYSDPAAKGIGYATIVGLAANLLAPAQAPMTQTPVARGVVGTMTSGIVGGFAAAMTGNGSSGSVGGGIVY